MSHITCQELIQFLDDYVAEGLESTRKEEFERHLSVCPSCVEYLRGYRDAIRLAKASASTPDFDTLPPEVLTAILETVRRKSPR